MADSSFLGRELAFWTRMALLWLMAVTVTGAAVRLTGSGLGCLDWPTCTANEELEAPGFHSAIEFGNRVVSGLAILPVIAAWLIARRTRRDLIAVIGWLVLGFGGQVVLGMLVTRTELDPRMVLGHFLLSIVLILLGVMLDFGARRPLAIAGASPATVATTADASARNHARLVVAAATVVIVVGTLVTGSGPHTGSEETGEPIARLGFDIVTISRIHALCAWVLVAILTWGLWKHRNAMDATDHFHRTWFVRLAGVAVAQGAVGYLQYALGVPVGLVAVHIVGAVLLWTAATWYLMEVSARAPIAERIESRADVSS